MAVRLTLAIIVLVVGGIAGAAFWSDRHGGQDSTVTVAVQPSPIATTSASTPVVTHQDAASARGSGSFPWIVGLIALLVVGSLVTVVIVKGARPRLAARQAPAAAGRYWYYFIDVRQGGGWMQIARGYIDFPASSLAAAKAHVIAGAEQAQPGHQYRATITPATEEAFLLAQAVV